MRLLRSTLAFRRADAAREEYKVTVVLEALWLHKHLCSSESLCKPPGLARPSITPTNDNARISAYRRTRKGDIYTAPQPLLAHSDQGRSISILNHSKICIHKMSTTRLTIYDLLRITYTYEGQALEQAARIRRDSVCSVCRLHVHFIKALC